MRLSVKLNKYYDLICTTISNAVLEFEHPLEFSHNGVMVMFYISFEGISGDSLTFRVSDSDDHEALLHFMTLMGTGNQRDLKGKEVKLVRRYKTNSNRPEPLIVGVSPIDSERWVIPPWIDQLSKTEFDSKLYSLELLQNKIDATSDL